eukprot:CAMPEP_0113438040 /NCGR_PEP_ID=MMETSP0013_2-20120614/37741_1 /TAXON_ID=2843 ORGANISM="Skeletonema costatum, Strain 1716" /NCGR_SAMPLE_ID=MMETSP0013_2 /ASSEMBLY_ACC=CAM_ASM_000158 /LENGTH=1458 /DNA_ID=CAMNT_0000328743 /DNA_START=208 /DNA_END=4584 /DNA_ORIENTATION=+ /assembly_acc=CAM_ASM_000158
MGTEAPTVIKSLTSNRTGGPRSNNTTSLAEALATTVADYMCEGGGNTSSALRKNGEILVNPLKSPSSAMAPLNSNSNLSSEKSKGRNMPPPPPRSASTTGISENNTIISQNNNIGSSATSTITTTSNGSSMGSTIEDLASICNFRQQTSSSSAPIISGTAAEVLALQNALRDYSTTTNTSGAIVSNPSSVESPISPPASTPSNSSLARNASDGAPMISGTAAAQMAMIATAAKITENGGHSAAVIANNHKSSHDASRHHAFQHGSGLDVDAVASLKVGHHDHLRQISPEDLSSSTLTSTTIGNASSSGSSSCNHWNQTRPLHIKSATTTKGGAGGMDILAEITCHAPPMPLFQQQHYQQAPPLSADSASSYQQIYHQVKHRVSGIPSYQEIYREMGQQQQQQSPAFHQRHGYIVESVDDISKNTAQHHSTTTRFGHPPSRDLLEEGKELYTRKDLITYGGHLCENKDVHGNMKDGCDSIVIANLEKDIREGDGLIWFLFSTDRTNGGGALCKSFHRKLPVRVFRSSTLSGRYAPPYLDDEENEEDDEIAYRYDGLYTIDAVWDVHGQETETFPCLGVDGWQTYFFTRVPKRPLEKEKHVAGMQYNKLGMQELWSEVQKMRGVRRPKKFEIPMAPIKLSAMKRVAITGHNVSRKVGAYHPPSLEELQQKQREERKQQAKLLKRQQSSTSSKSSASGLKRVHDNSQSSEEEDKGDADGNDMEEDETKHRSHSPISRKSASNDKVVTPRPRLNSSASPRNKGNTNYDSSDSDSSTRGRRSPTKLPSPKISSTNVVDSSLFFPKRASAAKAENANREMFGKKKRPYNRKSSTKGGTKRKKADESDSDDDDEESSDEGGLIDQAVLTVGSRVLVQYKGSVFKATIRKRREKNDKHSFLIHYDGNKKTNVHWVPLERLTEILSINLDAPPLPETTSRGGAVKRKAKKAKRPAVQRQKQTHSHSDSGDEAIAKESSVPQQRDVKVDTNANDNDANKTESLEPPQADEPGAAGVTAENQADSKKDEMDVDAPNHAAEDDDESLADTKPAAFSTKQQTRKTVVLDLERASSLNNPPEKDEESGEDASQIENESTSSVGAKPKQVSGSSEKFKHPIGGCVYVEYGRSKVFYHSTIVNARKKRSACEYLVHYDGYKKSANRWVKESALHEVNSDTTRRFEEQRNVPDEILYEDAPVERSTRGRKAGDQDRPPQRARRMRSDVSELSNESVLGNIEPGVAFLQGSVVFTEWKGVLFLAKMVKKRYSGDRTEYLVSYDGYSSKYDAWVSIHKIYEVNPQTKRAFKRLKAGQDPPGGKRKDTRKQEEDDDNDEDVDENTVESAPKKRVYRKKSTEESSTTGSLTRRGSRKRKDDSSEATARSSTRASRTSTLDMQGIESGVDFLPGSTIFAEYKGGLCLAKMIKKRGKGDYMEYYIQYMGLKKTEEAWMSVGLLYEINPQTKRMFRVYSKKA